ncbi:MAG TPA: ATP-dependent DNA helicase, partial [Firmicutes bacterium]|nr:ATP-dependent DNA helicase [Bacillota bacterium]
VSKGQKAILEALKANHRLTGSELAKAASLSVSTIKKSMVKLQELGLIERFGSKRYGYWILK